ncbi:hypothetical protein AB1Y20_022465 [Prymnesium parvum]|uniref:Uncharacterized protein n=1 Tax=Prymnesium parvum TaxID=97485 RepID=A0AB34JG97_PRYPA
MLIDGFRVRGLQTDSSQVNRTQLRQVVASLGVPVAIKGIDGLFNSLDPHATGTIDLRDLMRELRAYRRLHSSKASFAAIQSQGPAHPSTSPSRPSRSEAQADPCGMEASAFQLVGQGRLAEALPMLEEALMLYQRQLGSTSPEALRCRHAAADVCNSVAMQYLQQDAFNECHRLLKRAEAYCRSHRPMLAPMLAVTLNNLACYHRRRGQSKTALGLLQRALDVESRCEAHKPADTHLNTCVVWSQLGRHHEAMHHAKLALLLLRKELGIEGPIGVLRQQLGEEGEQSPAKAAASRAPVDRMAVLAICMHNLGIEQEQLGLKQERHFPLAFEARASLNEAASIAALYVGDSHPITASVRATRDAAARSKIPFSAGPARTRPVSAQTIGRDNISIERPLTNFDLAHCADRKKLGASRSSPSHANKDRSQRRPQSALAIQQSGLQGQRQESGGLKNSISSPMIKA